MPHAPIADVGYEAEARRAMRGRGLRPPSLDYEVAAVIASNDGTFSVEVVAHYSDLSVTVTVEASGLSRELASLKACLVASQRGAVRVVLPPEGGAQVRRRSW